ALLQRRMALAQELHVVLAPDEAHVRDGVDESARLLKDAVLHLVRPELLGDLERLGNAYRLADVDAAVGFLRRVVQLAERRMASAGIVPGVGAFLGNGG